MMLPARNYFVRSAHALDCSRIGLPAWPVIFTCGTLLIAGLALRQPSVLLGGIGVGAAAAALVMLRRRNTAEAPARDAEVACEKPEPRPVRTVPTTDDGLGGLIEEMLSDGRHALLLRAQLVGNLRPDQLERTTAEMGEAMSLVPGGEVALAPFAAIVEDESTDAPHRLVGVESFYLDRYAVTNRQYSQFVASGGYEQMSIWDPEIWPAVLDFVDRTGTPGPRYWSHGRYASELENHPVVGVSWYEAAAYARWVGKRLPTDAEWVKAASWPITIGGGPCVQRRYPWGESMDRTRANVWGSGPAGTVAVNEFVSGASVGGIYQLIGNVWEWTSGELDWRDAEAVALDRAAEFSVLKSLRGGAFNTYFETQANCQFQSGDHPLARKANLGFRCALSVCDVARPLAAADELDADDQPQLLAEAAL